MVPEAPECVPSEYPSGRFVSVTVYCVSSGRPIISYTSSAFRVTVTLPPVIDAVVSVPFSFAA